MSDHHHPFTRVVRRLRPFAADLAAAAWQDPDPLLSLLAAQLLHESGVKPAPTGRDPVNSPGPTR